MLHMKVIVQLIVESLNPKKEEEDVRFESQLIDNVYVTLNFTGVWIMHCHLDVHLPWGLATAFVVENGPTPSTRLPPPPADLPQC